MYNRLGPVQVRRSKYPILFSLFLLLFRRSVDHLQAAWWGKSSAWLGHVSIASTLFLFITDLQSELSRRTDKRSGVLNSHCPTSVMDGECEGASYKCVFDPVRCPRSGPGSNELLVGCFVAVFVWRLLCENDVQGSCVLSLGSAAVAS